MWCLDACFGRMQSYISSGRCSLRKQCGVPVSVNGQKSRQGQLLWHAPYTAFLARTLNTCTPAFRALSADRFIRTVLRLSEPAYCPTYAQGNDTSQPAENGTAILTICRPSSPGQMHEGDCTDGLDNNCNGLIDADDPGEV